MELRSNTQRFYGLRKKQPQKTHTHKTQLSICCPSGCSQESEKNIQVIIQLGSTKQWKPVSLSRKLGKHCCLAASCTSYQHQTSVSCNTEQAVLGGEVFHGPWALGNCPQASLASSWRVPPRHPYLSGSSTQAGRPSLHQAALCEGP